MVRREGFKLLHKKMQKLDPTEQESYKCLKMEQSGEIKTKVVYERVKGKVKRRMKLWTQLELNDAKSSNQYKRHPRASFPNKSMQIYKK